MTGALDPRHGQEPRRSGLLGFVRRVVRSRRVRRQRAEWSAIAEPLGFRTEVHDGCVVIVGAVAGRPFELDTRNFLAYGLDAELGMRADVEDPAAGFMVLTHAAARTRRAWPDEEPEPPSGDPEFDALFLVRANPAGRAVLARWAPAWRRVLVEHPRMEVHLRQGRALVTLASGAPERASIQAAARVLAGLIEATRGPATATPEA